MKGAHFFLKEAKLLNSTVLDFTRGKQSFPVPQFLLPNPNSFDAGDLKRFKFLFKKIDNSFPWYVPLSTIEMTSKCSKLKWNHKPRASSFTAKF